MRGFEETRPARDICFQHYVRADKSGTALARACVECVYPNLGQAEFETTTPGSLSRESQALPLSHCALQTIQVCTPELVYAMYNRAEVVN